MLILFGMPIAQILIFGYVVTNEIRDANIAIMNLSKDRVTMAISDKILSGSYFKLYKEINSYGEIEDAFKAGKVKEVIIFSPDFETSLNREGSAEIQIIADASDANTATLVASYTNAIVIEYIAKLRKSMGNQISINTETRMLYNQDLEGAYMFVPGTMALILMLISAMMTSISIAREKETGTMEVLLVSPLKPVHIIIGKVIPYIFLSFINAVSIIVIGNLIFGVPVNGSVMLLMGESILFIILALSIGIFISTVSSSQQVAMFISMFALLLPTMLLSGFIFPIDNMPVILQWLSYIIPPKYFIIILKNIMLKGTGMAFVWKETLIITGMLLFFILASIKKFKIRLEKA